MKIDSITQLKYLDYLINYGSYTKAAQHLYISQSYLTQTIKRIEQELAVEIINRKASPLNLTKAGLAYYNYLMELEAKKEHFKKEISKYSANKKNIIRIGILSNLGTYLLPLFLPNYLKKYPDVKIELCESFPRESEHKLLMGELDFFIGQNSDAVAPNVITHNCGMHQYCIVIPESSKYYQKDAFILSDKDVALPDLLREPLVLTSKGSAIRRQVDELLSQHQITPTILLETDNIFTAIELAKNDLGLTLFPENLEIKWTEKKYNLYFIPSILMSIRYFIAHHNTKHLAPFEMALIDFFIKFLNHHIK